jgi:uncharacterized DUF497 family protein
MTSAVSGFDWDEGNRDKCQKHGLSVRTIESLFHRPLAVFPDSEHSAEEERFMAIGTSRQGRRVFIVFTLRTRGAERAIRVISARYMHQKEVEHYEKETARTRK